MALQIKPTYVKGRQEEEERQQRLMEALRATATPKQTVQLAGAIRSAQADTAKGPERSTSGMQTRTLARGSQTRDDRLQTGDDRLLDVAARMRANSGMTRTPGNALSVPNAGHDYTLPRRERSQLATGIRIPGPKGANIPAVAALFHDDNALHTGRAAALIRAEQANPGTLSDAELAFVRDQADRDWWNRHRGNLRSGDIYSKEMNARAKYANTPYFEYEQDPQKDREAADTKVRDTLMQAAKTRREKIQADDTASSGMPAREYVPDASGLENDLNRPKRTGYGLGWDNAYNPVKIAYTDRADSAGWHTVDTEASDLPNYGEKIFAQTYTGDNKSPYYGKEIIVRQTMTQQGGNMPQLSQEYYVYDEAAGKWSKIPAADAARLPMVPLQEHAEEAPQATEIRAEDAARKAQAGYYRQDVAQLMNTVGKYWNRDTFEDGTPVSKQRIAGLLVDTINERQRDLDDVNTRMNELESMGQTGSPEYARLRETKERIAADMDYMETADVMFNPDFEQKSQAKDNVDDPVYQILNGQKNWTDFHSYDDEGQDVWDDKSFEQSFMGFNQDNRPTAQQHSKGMEKIQQIRPEMDNKYNFSTYTDEQIGIFNYLYETQGQEAAYGFLDKLQNYSMYNSELQRRERTQAFLDQNVGTQIVGSILSIGSMPVQTGQGFVQTVRRVLGEEVSPFDVGGSVYRFANTTQQTIRDKIQSPVGQFAFDLGWSAVQSTASMFMGGGFAAGTAASAATRAMTTMLSTTLQAAPSSVNQYEQMIAEGMKPENAALIASVGFGMELTSEMIGGEFIYQGMGARAAAMPNKGWQKYAKLGIMGAVTGLSEGTEELPGQVVERVIDDSVNGYFSTHNTRVRQIMREQGLNEVDASVTANMEWATQTMREFLIAGLSAEGSHAIRLARGWYDQTPAQMTSETLNNLEAQGVDTSEINRDTLTAAFNEIKMSELTGSEADLETLAAANEEIRNARNKLTDEAVEAGLTEEWNMLSGRFGNTEDTGAAAAQVEFEDAAQADENVPGAVEDQTAPVNPLADPVMQRRAADATERTAVAEREEIESTPEETPAGMLSDTSEQEAETPEDMIRAAEEIEQAERGIRNPMAEPNAQRPTPGATERESARATFDEAANPAESLTSEGNVRRTAGTMREQAENTRRAMESVGQRLQERINTQADLDETLRILKREARGRRARNDPERQQQIQMAETRLNQLTQEIQTLRDQRSELMTRYERENGLAEQEEQNAQPETEAVQNEAETVQNEQETVQDEAETAQNEQKAIQEEPIPIQAEQTEPATAQSEKTDKQTGGRGRSSGGANVTLPTTQTRSADTKGRSRLTFQPLTQEEFKDYRRYQMGRKELSEERARELGERYEAMVARVPTHAVFNATATLDGKDVRVDGIQSTGQGATVRLVEDGVETEAPISELEFDSPFIANAYERAAAYSDLTTARRYLAGWEQTTLDPISYDNAFSAVYSSALNGTDLTGKALTQARMLEPGIRAMVAERAAQVAEERDPSDLDMTESERAQMAEEVRSYPTAEKEGQTGVVLQLRPGRNLTAKQQAWVSMTHTLGQISGQQIVITDRLSGDTQGMYVGGNTMYVDLNHLEGAALLTASHESWHYVKNWAASDERLSEGVRQLEEMIDRALAADPDYNQEERIARYQARYKDIKGQELTRDQALEEIRADALRAVADRLQPVEWTSDRFGEVGRKLTERLKKWQGWIRRTIKRLGRRSAEVRAMLTNNEETLGEIAQRFEGLMSEVMAGREMGQLTEREATGERYALQNSLALDMQDTIGPETVYGDHAKFSLRVDNQEMLDFLENQEHITTYKTMKLLDGKLYPPKATLAGRGAMEDYSVLGQWEQATEHPEWIKLDKKGNPVFDLVENGSKTTTARYNPYMHSSNLMINDQFTGAYLYDDEGSKLGRFVTVECEVPSSEATSGYHAQYAKDSTGWHDWHAGTVAGAIHNQKGIERQVFLSRWIKPVRIVPDAEVAKHYAELIEGTNIEIPDNVVPPSLLRALEEEGVPIKRSGRIKNDGANYSLTDEDYLDAVDRGDMETAARMVEEAAKAAGYTRFGYHGTKQHTYRYDALGYGEETDYKNKRLPFTIFKPGQSGGIYLATNRKVSEGFAQNYKSEPGTVMSLFVRFDNPMIVNEHVWTSVPFYYNIPTPTVMKEAGYTEKDLSTEEISHFAQENGYDGLIIEGIREGGDVQTDDIIAFKPEQLKLADPVVYDDAGNVIPLSQRFNTEEADIRYSLSDEDNVLSDEGEVIAGLMPDGQSIGLYSLSSFNEQEVERIRIFAANHGFSAEQVNEWIDGINSIAAIVARDKARLDYEADPDEKSKKPNGEYKWTMDMSTLCPKRLWYQGTFNAIQKMMNNVALFPEDMIELKNMMDAAGYTTPCGICYLESRRKFLGKVAREFQQQYKGDYIPTIDELTTTDGRAQLKKNHNKAYKAFILYNNKRGSGSTKPVQNRTDYRGEIRRMSENTVRQLKDIGGLRLQSFSDFETPHMLDMMQVTLDMALKNLTSQAYTKVPDFARVFGGTGIKINLSLIGKGTGLDANGNLVFDDKEGMPFDQAMALRDMYSENVGTILVGINRAHILAAMRDDRIDFIIPFHASGWSEENRMQMNTLREYEDFTPWQNERRLSDGKKADKNLTPNGPDGYWDHTKSGKENAQIYLDECARLGLIPKFDIFLDYDGNGRYSMKEDGSTDGYWKLLIDFKMYDNEGNNAPQQEVQPNFNMEAAKEILAKFDGTGVNSLPVAQDVVDKFVQQYRETHAEDGTLYSLSDEEEDLHDTLLSVDEYNPEMFRLTRENEDLRRLITELGAELNSYKSRGIEIDDPKTIATMARRIRRETHTTVPMTDLRADLTEIYHAMSEAKTPAQMQAAMQSMSDLAYYALQNSQEKDTTLSERYAEERATIRHIQLGRGGWQMAAGAFGDLSSARKALGFLGFNQVRGEKTDIDDRWAQLHEINPAAFPDDVLSEEDKLVRMADFYEATGPQYYNPYRESRADGYVETAPEAEIQSAAARLATDMFSAYIKQGDASNRSARAGRIDALTARVEELFTGSERSTDGAQAVNERWKRRYQRDIQGLRDLLKEQARDIRADARVERAWAVGEARAEERERSDARRTREAARRSENEERRQTIAEIVRKKNSLQKKLETPNANGWVPQSMRDGVKDLLAAISDNEGGESEILTAEMLLKAKNRYEEIGKEKADGTRGPLASYYNGDLKASFDYLIEHAPGKKINSRTRAERLTQEELNHLRDIVSGYAAAIINENRMFTDERRADLAVVGQRMIDQAKGWIAKYGEQKTAGALASWFREGLSRGLLKPVTVFGEYEGTELGRIWEQSLRPAEMQHIRQVTEDEAFFQRMIEKYAFLQEAINQDGKRKTDKNSTAFEMPDGRTLRLTNLELMTLYAWNKREGLTGTNHLLGGGITMSNAQKGETHAAYQLTEGLLNRMINTLSAEEKACADEMVRYLSTTVGERGNRVTQELYGVDKFTESYYLPFSVNKNYVASTPGQMQDQRLKTGSFTKALTEKASTTLELQSFTSLWAAHCEQMSDYAAFTLPMEDITRLMNYRTGMRDEEGNYIGQGDNVRPLMQRAWGEQSVSYIHDFLSRLNGNSRGEHGGGWINNMMGKAKGAAVTFNLSVAMQQMGAGVRAAAEMADRDVLAGMVEGINFRRGYRELEQWAPIAIEKSWGYFDTNMKNGLYDRQKTGFRQKFDEAGGKMAETGDKLNWSQIWAACKHETRRLHPELSGDAFFRQAAERFTEVIDKTQVVDSVFQRSAWATEKGLMKNMMAFMSEPVTQYNMLYRAVRDLSRSIRSKDGTTGQSARNLVKQVRVIAFSAAMTAALKSLVSGLRDRKREKKDEDGNIIGRRTYWERVGDSYWENFAGNVLGLMTVFGNMWDSASATYSSGALDVAWLTNAYRLSKEILKGENADPYRLVYYSAQTASNLTGIGVGGLVRDAYGIGASVMEHINDDIDYTAVYDKSKPMETRVAALERNFVYNKEYKTGDQKAKSTLFTDMMVEIYLQEGMSPNFERVADIALATGANNKSLQTTFKTKLRASEERIPAAAKALYDGDMDTYYTLMDEILAGGIGEKAAVSMVQSEYKAIEQANEPETEETAPERGADVIGGLKVEAGEKESAEYLAKGSKKNRLNEALESGDRNEIGAAVREAKANGMTAEELRKTFSGKYKKAWIEACYSGNTAEQQRLRGIMLVQDSGVTADDLTEWPMDVWSSNQGGLYWMIREGKSDDAKRVVRYMNTHYKGGQAKVKERVLNWAKGLKKGKFDYNKVYNTLIALGFAPATVRQVLKK